MSVLTSGTLTFLYTDIEGSTIIAQQYPEAMPSLLARHHLIQGRALWEESVVLRRSVGDRFLLAYSLRRLADIALQQGDFAARRR